MDLGCVLLKLVRLISFLFRRLLRHLLIFISWLNPIFLQIPIFHCHRKVLIVWHNARKNVNSSMRSNPTQNRVRNPIQNPNPQIQRRRNQIQNSGYEQNLQYHLTITLLLYVSFVFLIMIHEGQIETTDVAWEPLRADTDDCSPPT